jgi:hypothetical protein
LRREFRIVNAMALPRFLSDHPESTGETYREHSRVAFGISRQLAGAAAAALIHAILPGFHKTTASTQIHRLHRCLEAGDREALLQGVEPRHLEPVLDEPA